MARTDIAYNDVTENNQFDRLGYPGKYYGAINFIGGQLDLTGSNFGYGAFIYSGSAHPSNPGTMHIAGGASVNITTFSPGVVHEVSISMISGSALRFGAQPITFLRRQQ